MAPRRPKRSYSLLFLASAAGLAAAAWGLWRWPPLVAWLAACNATGFALWSLDKWQAGRGGARVPEVTLHLASLLGAALAALVAMALLRHKTRRWAFYALNVPVFFAQVAALLWRAGYVRLG